jgi:hypothetical protein
MLKCLPVVLLTILLLSCGEKKKPVSGDVKVEKSDFFDAFPTLKLPFSMADSNLNDNPDTATIGFNVFTQFSPDTLFTQTFGSNTKPTIHPIGKYEVKGKETYLVVNAKSKNKFAVYLLVYDKNKKLSASMPLLISNDENNTTYTAGIDNRFAISVNKEWKTEQERLYKRIIYAYNTAGTFTVVMTETNDQSGLSNKLNNPLDTFPKNNKYSGDYIKGKKSIVAIRDGKTPNSYLFFVHFENDDEEPCTGELKGELVLNTPTSGVFNDDPCVINFSFTSSKVNVKEKSGCGSFRGIKCFFNDTFSKKKEQKAPKKSSK